MQQKPFYERTWFWYLLFAVLAYFLVFHKLGYYAIKTWDESLFATRAFYWAWHGEYFTNWKDIDFSSLNHPNTKPPLVSLVQAFFLKLFHYQRFGLRFPIAVMGLLCAIMLIEIFRKQFQKFGTGLLAAVVLLSSQGFNQAHVLGTGDQDVALAFLLLMSLIFYWKFYNAPAHNNRYLLLFFAFTGLAVITKSIMGFFMLPGIALYTILYKSVPKLLVNRFFYLGIVLMLAIISSFYLTMEAMHPHFLQLVWDNEVGGRYTETIDNHKGPWYHYLVLLFSKSFMPFTLFALLGVWFGFKSQNLKLRSFSQLIAVSCLVFLTILSLAGTKLYWYMATAYPLLSALAALGMVGFVQQWMYPLFQKKWPRLRLTYFTTLVLILGMAVPIIFMVKTRANNNTRIEIELYEIALDKLHREHPEYRQIRLHTRCEWYPTLIFVANKYSKVYGYDIDLVNSQQPVHDGDYLLGNYHPRMAGFTMEKVAQYGHIRLYHVLSTNEGE